MDLFRAVESAERGELDMERAQKHFAMSAEAPEK